MVKDRILFFVAAVRAFLTAASSINKAGSQYLLKFLSGDFTALGLSEVGEIILYDRVDSRWIEAERFRIVQ